MSPGSPTWYDVLGISPDASSEDIKRAWREATDRFEPGSASGQFRMYNEAADVLLDPRRRAEYDESLAGRSTATTGAVPLEQEPQPEAERKAVPDSGLDSRPDSGPDSGPGSGPVPAPVHEPDRPDTEPVEEEAAAGQRRPGLAVVVAAVLAVLAVATLALVGWLVFQVRDQGRVDDARTEAPPAAEAAAKAMLSYDYRTLPADRQRASGYLTPGYRKKYLQTFRLLEKNKDGSPGVAVQTKTVVSANVMGSGVVDVDQDTARVLVYVDQSSQKQGQDPQVFQNRVTMTMVRHGDRWLVDNLNSY